MIHFFIYIYIYRLDTLNLRERCRKTTKIEREGNNQGRETSRDRQAQLAQTGEKPSINEGERGRVRVILDTANRLKSSNLQARVITAIFHPPPPPGWDIPMVIFQREVARFVSREISFNPLSPHSFFQTPLSEDKKYTSTRCV